MKTEQVDIANFVALEQELYETRQENGLPQEITPFGKAIDFLLRRVVRQEVTLKKRIYVLLAVFLGSLCGAHRYYAGQKLSALFYLAFCWTGLSFILTVLDLLAVLPRKADENGMITI